MSLQGTPASDKQLAYLQALLRKAGYDGFREARRPLGLTQRQGSGKFTRPEASALIDRLLGDDDTPNEQPLPVTDQHSALNEPDLRDAATEALAAELTRRGWTLTPPER